MASPVHMPKFGMTQTEATVVRWLRQEGDCVERGVPLVEVETDKAVMEVEAPADGVLRRIRAQAGEVVPVTAIIAYITAAGEDLPVDVPAGARPSGRGAEALPRMAAHQATAAPGNVRGAPSNGAMVQRAATLSANKIRATPAARRLAREAGVDLATLGPGRGPRGRLQEADVLAARAPTAAAAEVSDDVEVIPLEGLRRRIATRLQASYQTAPHVTLSVEADMTAALALLAHLNAVGEATGGARISVTALLVRVCAWALRRHPWVNASLRGEVIHLHRSVHVGVAVAVEGGIVVPVVRHADRLSTGEIAARLEDLAESARTGRVTPDDVTGGTFTITNLGMYGVNHFTAIINPPEVAILATGRILKRAVVAEMPEGDEIITRPVMTMTLSADHRVLDGAVAARFLQDIVKALEQPEVMLL